MYHRREPVPRSFTDACVGLFVPLSSREGSRFVQQNEPMMRISSPKSTDLAVSTRSVSSISKKIKKLVSRNVVPALPAPAVPCGEVLVHKPRDVHGSHARLDEILLAREVRHSSSPERSRPDPNHLVGPIDVRCNNLKLWNDAGRGRGIIINNTLKTSVRMVRRPAVFLDSIYLYRARFSKPPLLRYWLECYKVDKGSHRGQHVWRTGGGGRPASLVSQLIKMTAMSACCMQSNSVWPRGETAATALETNCRGGGHHNYWMQTHGMRKYSHFVC